MELGKEKLLKMYELMQDARNFDMKINQLVRRGFVQGMTHFSVGEEAAGIAVTSSMTDKDILFTTHRGHSQCIGKGMDINKMMAELAGKVTGVSKGKGGSMHLADIQKGNYGTNGIVGGGFALAVGAAFTQKKKKTGNFVVAICGDGSTNEGSFHESVNMAATWKLPVIFFIINNKYGISMDIQRATNTEHLYTRAQAYGILGLYEKDGNDVIKVYNEFQKAIEHVKNGNGPVIMEVESYRWFGHSTADAGVYRTKEEVDEWKKKDPLIKFADYLIEKGVAIKEELEKMEEDSKQKILDAVEYAKNSPDPTLDVAFEDVYSD